MKKYLEYVAFGICLILFAGLGFLQFLPNYDTYFFKGDSMIPTLNNGDWLIIETFKGEIRLGDIVTYEYSYDSDKGMTTHRVIGVDDQNLITKGDANEKPDPWRVSISDVKGVYLFKIPYLGYHFWKIPLGTFLMIMIPLGWIIVYVIRIIKKGTM